MFLKELNYDITLPRALPVESAKVVVHSLKFRFSSKTTPRYLYLGTKSSNSLPNVNLDFVSFRHDFLKCTTWLFAMFTFSFQLVHQSQNINFFRGVYFHQPRHRHTLRFLYFSIQYLYPIFQIWSSLPGHRGKLKIRSVYTQVTTKYSWRGLSVHLLSQHNLQNVNLSTLPCLLDQWCMYW